MKEILERYVSRTKFAAMCGVSTTSIRRAVNSGRLAVMPGRGKRDCIDLQDPKSIIYQETDRSNYQNPQKKKKRSVGRPKGAKKPPRKKQVETPELPEFVDDTPVAVTTHNAQVIKLYETIRQTRVKTAKEQGSLVNRDRIALLFAKLYTIDANEWKMLPANAASEVAAICGADDKDTILKIEQLLENKVFSILRHARRLILDYIEEIEGDPDASLDKI